VGDLIWTGYIACDTVRKHLQRQNVCACGRLEDEQTAVRCMLLEQA